MIKNIFHFTFNKTERLRNITITINTTSIFIITMRFSSVCLLDDKLKDPFMTPFVYEPYTIHDSARDMLKFFQTEEPLYWKNEHNILPSSICEDLIYNSDKDYSYRSRKEPNWSLICNTILELTPSKYKGRSRIGIGKMLVHKQQAGHRDAKINESRPYQDDKGNPSLLSVWIFLNSESSLHNKVISSPITFNLHSSSKISKCIIPIIKGDLICMDYSYSNVGISISSGTQYILKVDIVYDLLPKRSYDICSEIEICVLKRGCMQKAFINNKDNISYSFNRTITKEEINDPSLEPCVNCGKFIKIIEETCPHCNDHLIHVPFVKNARMFGKWISLF